MALKPRKDKDKGKSGKLVWRISSGAPLGEYVHPGIEAAKPAEPNANPAADGGLDAVLDRSWHFSSFDLAQGTDVREEPLDTLPDELLDHFTKKPPK